MGPRWALLLIEHASRQRQHALERDPIEQADVAVELAGDVADDAAKIGPKRPQRDDGITLLDSRNPKNDFASFEASNLKSLQSSAATRPEIETLPTAWEFFTAD